MFLFKKVIFLMALSGSILAQLSGIVIPHQQITWLNAKGDVYSPFDKKGYYHKALLQLNIPATLEGEFYVGVQLDNNDTIRTINHINVNQKLKFSISEKTNTNFYILDWPMVSSSENFISFKLMGNNMPVKKYPFIFG